MLYTSDLYEYTRKKIDEEIRKSQFKIFTDITLFDLVGLLVNKLNILDKNYTYTLLRNDITYIKYSEGDFFEDHADYLSFTSNEIEEFTMFWW